MASEKILNLKKTVVDEISNKIDNSESVVLFSYHGLNVSDLVELRRKLTESNGELKVYKNTLIKLAADKLKLNMNDNLTGPNAIIFGKSLLEPIKTLSEFQKKHKSIKIRTGIINGAVVSDTVINEYASIPSMEGLLTMLAGGMMEHIKNLSISLNLYAENLGCNN